VAGLVSVLGFVVVVVAVAAMMERLDRRSRQWPSMSRISLTWNRAGSSYAIRHYALGRVGTLIVEDAWRSATAKAGSASWRFTTRGGLSGAVSATDEAGRATGEYHDRRPILRWGSRELDLRRGVGRRASTYRRWGAIPHDGRYALVESERIVAFLRADGDDFRSNPINIELDDATGAEPGLLLLAAFVATRLAWYDRKSHGD
jgi:hypothetical protein